MTTISLNLDTWLVKNVYVKANQGEVNSRFLEITLTDKSTPLDISGKTVVFYATKPDGNVIYNLCTIENAEDGVISVCLTSQMSAVAGKMPCEIHIIANDKTTLKIVGLELEIVKCADLEDAIESTSEFTALETAMAEYDEASDAIDAHIANKSNPHEVTAVQIGAASSNHSHNFSEINEKPSTLTGYGITDAVPSSRTVNSKALSSDITLTYTDVGAASSNHSHNFSEINEKPSTLTGYGITDAVPTSTLNNYYTKNETYSTDEVDTAIDTVLDSLTAHVSNTNNPHSVTLAQIGAASSTDVGSVANLNTTAKTVVGAINELYSAINGLVDGDEVNY